VDTKGNVSVSETLSLGIAALERSASSDGSFKHGATIGGVGTSFDSSGKAEVSVGAGYAYANPTKGQFGAGVGFEQGIGDAKFKAKVGISISTISKEAANHALVGGNPGVFGAPAELNAGKRWNQLSEAAQNMHHRNGWTEQEWTSKLPQARVA